MCRRTCLLAPWRVRGHVTSAGLQGPQHPAAHGAVEVQRLTIPCIACGHNEGLPLFRDEAYVAYKCLHQNDSMSLELPRCLKHLTCKKALWRIYISDHMLF